MRKQVCICDRCGKEITGGVVYSLTCYAEDLVKVPFGVSAEACMQNTTQNMAVISGKKDLCKECKDDVADGLFIV